MIRVIVIGTALLYGHALIGSFDPKGEALPGEELFNVSAEFDSVPFHNAARHAVHELTTELDDVACPMQEAHRI